MKKKLKPLMLVGMMLIAMQGLLAQSIPTVEMPLLTTATNSGTGAGINPIGVQFQNDALNNDVFSAYSPTSTFTVSLTNQQFTGLPAYGTANYGGSGFSTLQTTGLVFGIQPTLASAPLPQGGFPIPRYNRLGTYAGTGGPKRNMFTSNPTATGAQLGTGINPAENTPADQNGGVEIFTTAQILFYDSITYPRGSRVYYGNLVLTFSQEVKNPVIHVAGLGASYRFLRQGGNAGVQSDWYSTYFTTELELVNTGLSSTLLSGNAYMALSGNNIVNNNHVNPNGGSINDPTETINNNLGAATGSIKINGIVKTLTYRVYLQGGSASEFAWSKDGAYLGTPRDPFTGDMWYVAASYDKPTQQIFGNVFIDPQTTDNNINQSFGAPNSPTNAGGLLYANLISGGLVIATVPVSVNGDYLFDNVPVGSYTVQLSSNPGVVGQPQPGTALPSNWVNTGEFIGAGAGTDGSINGISASITINASDIITNVNFGIKAGPCPVNILYQSQIPVSGYFGGFEVTPAASNFYPNGVGVVHADGGARIYPNTTLAATDYSITANPNLFSPTLSSYLSLGGQNQMAVKPSANNQTVYYLVDSAGKTTSGFQIKFKYTPVNHYAFSGWFAKSTAADAVIKIRIYDADVTSRIFKDMNVTLTGAPGTWVYWTAPWGVSYGGGVVGDLSQTKKIRFDFISVNGAPFSIDELCFPETILGPPLPITMSDFIVNKKDCNANLVWKTSTESNSDRFEVEVSTGTNPVYTIAGTVSASGSSSSTKTYQFGYPMQAGVVYYFRIKMIDKDGSFIYSDFRSASCSKGSGGIVIAPNPTKDNFTIQGMENGKNIILVYGANGQLVKTQTSTTNNTSVNISYLAPGMYMVKITSESGNTVISKLIKY